MDAKYVVHAGRGDNKTQLVLSHRSSVFRKRLPTSRPKEKFLADYKTCLVIWLAVPP